MLVPKQQIKVRSEYTETERVRLARKMIDAAQKTEGITPNCLKVSVMNAIYGCGMSVWQMWRWLKLYEATNNDVDAGKMADLIGEVSGLYRQFPDLKDDEVILFILDMVDEEQRMLFYRSEEPETHYGTQGELFRWCQKLYGKCTSKVYVDTDEGTIECGWVFKNRERYDGCNDTYLRSTWVTLVRRSFESPTDFNVREL